MKIVAPTYFQNPNDLVDQWLPHLKEVELKVLLVIIRKTFGWHKQRDKISLSQMIKITGSCRQSVVDAIESLKNKGLILKETIGKSGFEETWYELIVEDSNNSTQSKIQTPPSLNSRPPPVQILDPQNKPSLTERDKETNKQGCLSVSSFEDQIKILTNAGLDENSISTIRTLNPTTDAIKNALECARQQKYDNLGGFVYTAIKNGWRASKKKECLIPENRSWALDLFSKIKKIPKGIYFEVLSKYLEIGYTTSQSIPLSFFYHERNFKDIVLEKLKKIGADF